MKLGHTLFYVDDVEKTMHFYEKAFGLKPGFVSDGKEYGEMITGETKLGFVNHKTAVNQPNEKPWGQIVSYVRDCNGFLVEICSPM